MLNISKNVFGKINKKFLHGEKNRYFQKKYAKLRNNAYFVSICND
jgi:hypothetical protein